MLLRQKTPHSRSTTLFLVDAGHCLPHYVQYVHPLAYLPIINSQYRVLILEPLTDGNIYTILTNAILRIETTENTTHTTPSVLQRIVNLSLGDARTALNLLELVLKAPDTASEQNIFDTLKRTTISRCLRTELDNYLPAVNLHSKFSQI